MSSYNHTDSTRRVRCTFHRICDVFHAAAVLSVLSFETVIDRTATDDSQLNALLLSSAMHAHDKGAMHVNVRDETKKLSACGLKGVQTWKKK